MFDSKSIIFLVSSILVCCESGFVDHLPKCKINDGDCVRDLIQNLIPEVTKNGIPELGVPALDPIKLKNEKITILDILNLTIVEGILNGMKDCKVEKVFIDVEDEHAFMELSFDSVTLEGHYKAFASSPLIKTYLGASTANGDGNFKIKIDEVHLRLDSFFYIQRREDDIYIKIKRNKTFYKYDVGKMTFHVDNLYIGKQDASQMVTSLLNENWKLIMTTFGKSFTDRAAEIGYEFVYKFFDSVPCKYYISDDLTKYARS